METVDLFMHQDKSLQGID